MPDKLTQSLIAAKGVFKTTSVQEIRAVLDEGQDKLNFWLVNLLMMGPSSFFSAHIQMLSVLVAVVEALDSLEGPTTVDPNDFRPAPRIDPNLN